jgi:hypothetical protein
MMDAHSTLPQCLLKLCASKHAHHLADYLGIICVFTRALGSCNTTEGLQHTVQDAWLVSNPSVHNAVPFGWACPERERS